MGEAWWINHLLSWFAALSLAHPCCHILSLPSSSTCGSFVDPSSSRVEVSWLNEPGVMLKIGMYTDWNHKEERKIHQHYNIRATHMNSLALVTGNCGSCSSIRLCIIHV